MFRGVPLAQDSDVFQRQAEARLQFGVIDVDEPLADSFLTRIVAGPNQPADEPRPGSLKVRCALFVRTERS